MPSSFVDIDDVYSTGVLLGGGFRLLGGVILTDDGGDLHTGVLLAGGTLLTGGVLLTGGGPPLLVVSFWLVVTYPLMMSLSLDLFPIVLIRAHFTGVHSTGVDLTGVLNIHLL